MAGLIYCGHQKWLRASIASAKLKLEPDGKYGKRWRVCSESPVNAQCITLHWLKGLLIILLNWIHRTLDSENWRSVNLRMNFGVFKSPKKPTKFLTDFVPRAEICQKFGWLFGRFEDTKNSFWDQLTFRQLRFQFVSSIYVLFAKK